jgi:piezo-type mechanosensitive ion channel component 1/2
MFTDTSLGLSDWLQMEDIYANIFVLKCYRYNESVMKNDLFLKN